MSNWYQWQGEKLVLNILLQPAARKNAIVGVHGNALKIRITQPPVDGKANAFLCRYLAEIFGVTRSQVEIISGTSARTKRVRILPNDKVLPAALLNLVKFC